MAKWGWVKTLDNNDGPVLARLRFALETWQMWPTWQLNIPQIMLPCIAMLCLYVCMVHIIPEK